MTHLASDHVDDRVHRPDCEVVAVPLAATDPGATTLHVDLEQHDTEQAPRILLTDGHPTTYRLTPDEAVHVALALLHAVNLAA